MKPWIASLCLFLAIASAPSSAPTSIHRMIVGKKAFESLDTRQITTRADGRVGMISISPDGKYVVYVSGDERQQVSIIRTSGGHPTKLIDAASTPLDADGTSDWAYHSDPYAGCSPWSPDSRLIALPVARSVTDDSGARSQEGIIVFSPLGMKRALFTLTKSGSVNGRLFWSPDARRIACVVEVNHKGTDGKTKSSYELFVCDFVRGTAGSICSIEKGWPAIKSWGADGKTLRYTLLHRGSVRLCEIPADGGPSVTVEENYTDSGMTSPDGRMKLGPLTEALTVEQVGKPETIQLVLDKIPGAIIGWTPDSRFIVYARRGEIRDETGSRFEDFRGIWLAAPMSGERNHICAAVYVDERCVPSFSADCTKMAFTSRGNLHIAELAWTDLTPEEKADAGIPLTEEEEKDILTRNAKRIGEAMDMYTSDWDGGYPSGDMFVEQMGPYAYKTPNLFFRPGTENVAFQYTPPGDGSSSGNPSETVIGIFDVGYQWQIILYADGHVRVVPKTK